MLSVACIAATSTSQPNGGDRARLFDELRQLRSVGDRDGQCKVLNSLIINLRRDQSPLPGGNEECLRVLRDMFEYAGPLPETDDELHHDDNKALNFRLKMQSLVASWLLDAHAGRQMLSEIEHGRNAELRAAASEIEETDGLRFELSLSHFKASDLVEALGALFKSGNDVVRNQAALAIGRVRHQADIADDVEFRQTLVGLAEQQFKIDTSSLVRLSLIRSIEDVGVGLSEAREFFTTMSMDSNLAPELRRECSMALELFPATINSSGRSPTTYPASAR